MKLYPKISKIGYKATDMLYKKTAALAGVRSSIAAKQNISHLSDGLLRAREFFDVHTCEKRLTPEDALVAFTKTLGEINSQLALFSYDIADSTQALQKGSIEVFEKKHLVKLERRITLLRTIQQKITSISSLLGFTSKNEQIEAQKILASICNATDTDSAMLQFGSFSPIQYLYGFDHYETNVIRRAQPSWVIAMLRGRATGITESELSSLRDITTKFGLSSVDDIKWMDKLQDTKHLIKIFVFRHVGNNVSFSEGSHEILEVIKNSQQGLNDIYNKTTELYGPTSIQMYRARHDSGVNEIKTVYFPHTMSLRGLFKLGSEISALDQLKKMSEMLPLSIARTTTWMDIIRGSDVYGKTNITLLLRETVLNYKPRAQQKEIKLFFLIPNEDISVIGNNAILQRLINNLMDNALKYTERGTITLNAKVEPEKRRPNKHLLVISISDTGIGIPEKDIPNLFLREYRASNVGKIEGTGTGLAYIKEAVSGLLGQIDVESKEGKGSTFTLTLPIIE